MSHKNTDWNTANLTPQQIAAMEQQLERVAQQQILYERLQSARAGSNSSGSASS